MSTVNASPSQRIESWSLPPARFAEPMLAQRCTRLIEEVERCSAHPDVDGVHDLRVAIRRFSQALRIFAPMLNARAVKAVRRPLGEVMEASSKVRDLDVGIERLIDEGLPPEHAVLEQMRAERRRGELALAGRLLLLKSEEPERNWPARLLTRTH